MLYTIAVLAILLSYLLGSISSSILISKRLSGKDIRESGSGNAGATNMLRVHGKKAGIATLVCDAMKGVIAVMIGLAADRVILAQNPEIFDWIEKNILFGNLRYITGVFAVIGHDFPIFFGFKGGKGVATSLGVMLALNWKIGLIVAITSVVIMACSRYVSLGSIIGGILYPVSVLTFMVAEGDFNIVYFVCAVILGVIDISKHHANIKRLIKGTENKLFSKKS